MREMYFESKVWEESQTFELIGFGKTGYSIYWIENLDAWFNLDIPAPSHMQKIAS